jgi:hypothetical protein
MGESARGRRDRLALRNILIGQRRGMGTKEGRTVREKGEGKTTIAARLSLQRRVTSAEYEKVQQ